MANYPDKWHAELFLRQLKPTGGLLQRWLSWWCMVQRLCWVPQTWISRSPSENLDVVKRPSVSPHFLCGEAGIVIPNQHQAVAQQYLGGAFLASQMARSLFVSLVDDFAICCMRLSPLCGLLQSMRTSLCQSKAKQPPAESTAPHFLSCESYLVMIHVICLP